MFTKPLWFLKDYTTETNVNTWIDGYLRALFGVNDGTSGVLDILNTYASSIFDNACKNE